MSATGPEAHGHGLAFLRSVHNERLWDLATPAVRHLDEAGVPVVILKSLPQMIELYGDAGHRPMADVDLLVSGRRAFDVLEILRTGGWVLEHADAFDRLCQVMSGKRAAQSRPWHLLLFSQHGVGAIDLHSDSMDPWRDPPLDAHIWNRTHLVDTRGVQHLVLDDVDRLVYLCWHFVADGFPWGKLSDVQRVLTVNSTRDWHRVAGRAHETGMTTAVWLVCELAAQRSLQPMNRPWRDVLHPPIHQRAAAVRDWLAHTTDELDQRRTILVRTLLHDRLPLLVRGSLEAVLPGPVELVASGTARSTHPSSYVRALASLYRQRVFRRS